jgi:hypothetical protein
LKIFAAVSSLLRAYAERDWRSQSQLRNPGALLECSSLRQRAAEVKLLLTAAWQRGGKISAVEKFIDTASALA